MIKQFFKTYIHALKDGLNVVIVHLVAFIVLVQLGFLFESTRPVLYIVGAILIVSFMLTVNFFRNPSRIIKYKKDTVYSPADGVVSSIDLVHEKEFLNKKAYRIKIFMNVFNVHRNRIPLSGDIKQVKYIKGKMEAAFKEIEDSNERCIINVKTAKGNILMKQIAGLIARRIVCNIKSGDKLNTGDIFGMIKFGSSVIIYLPSNIKPSVKKGDKVKAGLTELGLFTK